VSKRVPALHSGAADKPLVTVGAVLIALDQMHSGRAPGPDGITVEFWRVGRGAWAPLLARLFSAMVAYHTLPGDFTLGRVVPLPKGGLASCPGNYRPIAQLNADYKILARILATRFGYPLQHCIGPHQPSFLQGREIGDSIFAAELLGSALATEQLPGVAVILDIAKAYDTVDRSFLFRIMEAARCGRHMLRWVQLLLSDTRAHTVVNGHVSKAQVWQAGFRQDCPSVRTVPVLYLFVAEALACWLRQCPELGVQVANQKHVSLHHADDTKVFLSSLQPEFVQSLVVRLDMFALASKQCINVAKSCVVPVGTLTTPPPNEVARVGPLTVVASKMCLGVIFAPATAQSFEPVGRERLRRPASQPAMLWGTSQVWGARPNPVQLGTRGCTRLASVELLCWGLTSLLWVGVWAQLGMQQPRSGIMQSLREFLLVIWRILSSCYNAR
jgi:hypothetical protein